MIDLDIVYASDINVGFKVTPPPPDTTVYITYLSQVKGLAASVSDLYMHGMLRLVLKPLVLYNSILNLYFSRTL